MPRHKRDEWLEEWTGELSALAALKGERPRGSHPSLAGFVAGALPHAVWMTTEGWTMDSVVQDLRYAIRVLGRAPGFALVAALTLALGIGANAAMFSLVNGLMFRAPGGIDEPDRLVQIARSYDEAPRWDNWSWPAAELIRSESDLLSGVAGYSGGSFVLDIGGDVQSVVGQYASGNYFQVLGVLPAVGRLLDPTDEVAPGAHPVVVLSYGIWQRRFGGDPGVVGTTVSIGSSPYEVVGVAPQDFVGVDALGTTPELWVPAMQRSSRGRDLFGAWGSSWYYLFGRLGDGVSFEAAEASMDAISMRLRSASDVNEDIRVLLEGGVGLAPEERAEGQRVMLLLGGIAALVLLLTCANVGNLFLARATTRSTEVGVRQALGAGRSRLIRQLVTESVLLALLATAIAVPLLRSASRVIPSLFPLPMAVSVAPDARVYLFLLGVGVLAGLLFGVAPAWAIARKDVAATLREGGTTGSRTKTRLRDGLVIGQLAISLGLVSGAALLGRSVLNARDADPGFDPDGLVVGFLNLRATGRYEGEAVVGFQQRLVAQLEGTAGVTAVALANQVPVLGGHARRSVSPAGRPDTEATRTEAEYVVVTPGYFATLRVPLVRGRSFRAPDEEPEPVVVINEALAARFWPGEDPVGRELVGRGQQLRVIGVVADVQMRSLRASANPAVYYPFHQEIEAYVAVHVRMNGPSATVAGELRRAVGAVDPEVPLVGVTDLREGLSRSLAETRTFGLVVSTFAGLALILSIIGLYGLVAHGVSQRSKEMGIRMALGAAAGEVVRLVVQRGMKLAVVGVLLGVAVAVGLGWALGGVLFGVSASDPLVLGGSAVVLTSAALVATWLPARRASRTDAAVSLRD